jgi:hypothetical protein
VDVVLQRQHIREQYVGLTPARLEIQDATLHDRRAQALAAVFDVRAA